MATNLLAENYLPFVRQSRQVRTKFPVVLSGTSATLAVGGTATITGAATLSSTLAVASTSTFTGVATFTAAPVFSSGTTRPTASSALVGATVILTAADSGKVLINRSTSGSPSWTLPTLADGLLYTFVCGNTTAGFTVTGAQVIQFKTTATGTALSSTTTLTNTQATAVVGDTITIVGDGTGNTWKMIAQSGIFAAS